MSRMYSFKDEPVVYVNNNLEITTIYAFKNFYLCTNDICKLFDIDSETLEKVLNEIFVDTLNEIETKYVYTHSENNTIIFYSLEVITTLGFIKNNKQIIDFILWANKTLRQRLINENRYTPKALKTKVITNTPFRYHHDTQYFINEINSSEINKSNDEEESLEDLDDFYNEEIVDFQKTYYR